MIYAVILFAATYVLMLALQKYRTYVALASALCFIVSGMLPLDKIVGSIDFNVLLMIAGTMGIVYGGSQIVINLTVINRIFLVSILSIDGLCCYQNTQAAKNTETQK